MQFIKRIIIFLVILVFCQTITSQTTEQIEPNFRKYSTKNGLSHNFVSSILKDQKGFMWVGTIKGLNRFDGYEFKTFNYNSSDKNSISNDNVISLVEHQPGFLIATAEIGLNIFDTQKEKFYRFYYNENNPEGLFSDLVYDLYRLNDCLYFIVTSRGLATMKVDINNGKPEITCTEDELAKKINEHVQYTGILSLTVDKDSILWLGTRYHGLLSMDLNSGKKEQFTFVDYAGFYSNQVNTLFDDNKGYIWVGTASQLYKLNKNSHEVKSYQYNSSDEFGVPSNVIKDIIRDEDGRMWFATYNGLGQYREETDDFLNFKQDEHNPGSLSNNFVHTLYNDGNGRLWIGTENGGINLYDWNRKDFHCLSYDVEDENSLSGPIINSICVDKKENLWIGTSGAGLDLFSPEKKKLKSFRHNPQDLTTISGNVVSAIRQDKNGNMWFGTWGFGLSKLSEGKYGSNDFTRPLHIPYNFISDIAEDSYGRLWVATSEGPLMKHPEKDTFLLLNTPDRMSFLGEICVDSNGFMYFPTLNDGLYVLYPNKDYLDQLNPDSSSIIHFKHDKKDTNSLPLHLLSMLTDKTGTVWLSTQGSGIIKIETPDNDITKTSEVVFKRINETDGLSDNVVLKILEDDNENIWASTSKGLSKYNYREEQFKNFYVEDGLLSNQFFWYAGNKDQKGNLYFGTTEGVNYFNPDKIKLNQEVPDALITDFMIMNNSVPISEYKNEKHSTIEKNIAYLPHVTLNHTDYIFSFTFSSNNYTLPERIKFAFMLEGFDKDWVYTNSYKRYARYTNIPGGKYVFKVKASNSDGIWSDNETHVNIRILPPWYETLLFKIISVLFLAVFIISFYYIRLAQINKQKKKLRIQVRNRTSELHRANMELLNQKNEIEIQKNEIEKQASELLHQRDELAQRNEEIKVNNEQLTKANENIMLLSEFSKSITSTLNIDSINKIIFEYVDSLIDVNNFGIGIFNRKTNSIDFPMMFEKGGKPLQFSSVLNDKTSCAAWCYKNQQEILSNDFHKEFNKFISDLHIRTTKIPGSVIYIPLNVENNRIGVLTVQADHKNAYSDYDFAMLQTLASSIAIALENANAYLKVREANKQLRIQTELLNETNIQLEERQQQIEEQAEELRAQSEELHKTNMSLQESNNTKDKLFSIIGHDLKNPLNAIMGFSELLVMRYDSITNEKKKFLLATLNESARSIFKLLDNLLSWARSLSGNIKYKPEELIIGDTINESLKLLNEMAESKDVTLKKHVQEQEKIICDKNILNTLLRNLISNAIKFTENGSIDVFVVKEGNKTTFEVRDTGAGMKPEVRDRIFDVKKSQSTKGTKGESGTGLGLILCKEFVDKLNGKIWVRSEEGKGSSFYFELPDMEIDEN